jgi:hypothetical protein
MAGAHIYTLVVAVAAAQGGASPSLPAPHVERAGGFSFVPPPGWKMVRHPSQPYGVAAGPRREAFTPTLFFTDREAAPSVAAFIEQTVKDGQAKFKDFKKIAVGVVKTDAGKSTAHKLVIESSPAEAAARLRQTTYVITKASGGYLVAYCTGLADEGAAFDALCDGALRTFKWEQAR